jgi:transposase-like protein
MEVVIASELYQYYCPHCGNSEWCSKSKLNQVHKCSSCEKTFKVIANNQIEIQIKKGE